MRVPVLMWRMKSAFTGLPRSSPSHSPAAKQLTYPQCWCSCCCIELYELNENCKYSKQNSYCWWLFVASSSSIWTQITLRTIAFQMCRRFRGVKSSDCASVNTTRWAYLRDFRNWVFYSFLRGWDRECRLLAYLVSPCTSMMRIYISNENQIKKHKTD